MGRLIRLLGAVMFVVEVAQLTDVPRNAFHVWEPRSAAIASLEQVRPAPNMMPVDEPNADPNKFLGEWIIGVTPDPPKEPR